MLIAERSILAESKVSEFRSHFTLEPLELGFGYTFDNPLRYILLSSIPGVAVTSIRIGGVAHEFRTIEDVKEDVVEIILNIKQIVLPSENDEPVVMYLYKADPGVITVDDVTPPAEVEVRNPELTLATLNEKGKLEIELTVEHGRGHVSATQNKDPQAEASRVSIDSIHSPVVKVTYKIEATRAEQRTGFDRLVINVETKSAIAPCDALASAGKTLVEFFGLVRELNRETGGIEVRPSTTDAIFAADLALPIESLNLQSHSCSALRRRGTLIVSRLIAHSKTDLLDVHNFGTKSIEEIKEALAGLGMTLKDSAMPSFGGSDSGSVQFGDEQSI